MVSQSERIALRVSASGKVQVARDWGSESEVLVELDLGQLEVVIQWVHKALAASASRAQGDEAPTHWFGGVPGILSGQQALPGAHRGVPVEVLAVLSRLPRGRAVSRKLQTPEEKEAGHQARPELPDGFAGIRWGTAVSEIPALADVQPLGETREGVPFYVTCDKLVNESGFSAYYVDPLTNELIGGAWVFSPTSATWASAWYDLIEFVSKGYPDLVMREGFLYHPRDPRQKVDFVDEDGEEVVKMSLDTDAGVPLLHVLYRSRELMRRQAQAIEEDRRKLGPVGDEDAATHLRLVRAATGDNPA